MSTSAHKARVRSESQLSRRERQKADRRNRIYQAAVELFAENGYHDTTVQQITDRADVGKGTFFNYFPSKEAILIDYYHSITGELIAYAEGLQARGTRARIAGIFRRAAGMAVREGRLFDILIREIFSRPALLELDIQNHERFLMLFAEVLSAGQRSGEVRPDVEIDTATRLVSGIFMSTSLEWAFLDKPYDMGEMLERKLDLIFQGIGNHAKRTR